MYCNVSSKDFACFWHFIGSTLGPTKSHKLTEPPSWRVDRQPEEPANSARDRWSGMVWRQGQRLRSYPNRWICFVSHEMLVVIPFSSLLMLILKGFKGYVWVKGDWLWPPVSLCPKMELQYLMSRETKHVRLPLRFLVVVCLKPKNPRWCFFTGAPLISYIGVKNLPILKDHFTS